MVDVIAGGKTLLHDVQNLVPKDIDTTPSGHFMTYFITAAVIVVALYLLYHNRQKV